MLVFVNELEGEEKKDASDHLQLLCLLPRIKLLHFIFSQFTKTFFVLNRAEELTVFNTGMQGGAGEPTLN